MAPDTGKGKTMNTNAEYASFGELLYSNAMQLKYPYGSEIFQFYFQYFKQSAFQNIIGCAPQDIEEIKQAQGVKTLPRFYIEYLERFGMQSGDVFLGLDVDKPSLLILKYGVPIIAPNFDMPDDMFVFRGQQDHTFLYFLTNADPVDPPVYAISEWTYEDDPEWWDEMPYKDEHGRGWPHLSHLLGSFILRRAGQAAYDEFLQQVAQLR